MKGSEVRAAVRASLARGFREISRHIEQVQALGKYDGIEKKFSSHLVRELPGAITEVPGKKLGAPGVYRGRGASRFDVVLTGTDEDDIRAAVELKAVRLPRRAAKGRLFDIGQLDVDYWKLRLCKCREPGWMVVFLYGPLVDDACTDAELFRRFHEQMYVDVSLCTPKERRDRRDAFSALGWDRPNARMNSMAFALIHRPSADRRALGAVCYRVDPDQ